MLEKPSEVKQVFNLKISRKVLRICGVVLAVILLGILIWQTKFYNTFWRWIMPADISVTVTDESAKPISGAVVAIQGKSVTTDQNGQAQVKKLMKTKKTNLKVSIIKYVTYNQDIQLKRGHNEKTVKLAADIRKVTVIGSVTNYVTGEVMSGLAIDNSIKKVSSNSDGTFKLTDVPVGELELKVSANGFIDKDQKVVIDDNKNIDVQMVPTGKVIFVSNRDGGKRGIFSSNYDGSESANLISRQGSTEDYNVAENNARTKIAFLSTRDGRKDKNGQPEANLYMASVNGKNLQKISEDFDINNISWSANDNYLAWSGRGSETNNPMQVTLYKVNSGETSRINQGSQSYSYYFNHSGSAIVWSQDLYQGQGEKGLFYRNLTNGDTTKINDTSAYSVSFTNNDQKIRFTYYDNASGATKNIEYTISSGEKADYQPSVSSDPIKVKSPDGKKYAYTSGRDGKSDIYISDLNGDNEQRLTTIGTVSGPPDWDLTGKYILFDSQKQDETARYIIGLTGAGPKKITDVYLFDNQGY